jgi:hypothetical protein
MGIGQVTRKDVAQTDVAQTDVRPSGGSSGV